MQKRGKRGLRGAQVFLEAGLGLGGVVAGSYWLPAAWRPSHLLFCAFFLVVFAIAVRYQMKVAYAVSVLAACIYGLLLWERPEMRAQPDLLPLALEPFLLLISGVLTSDLLRWQRQRLSALEQKYMQAEQALQSSQANYRLELRTREELERRGTGQARVVTALGEKVLAVWTWEGLERYRAILDLVVYGIEAQSCACYLWQDGVFHLACSRSGDESGNAGFLDLADPVLKQVIAQREVVTIRDVSGTEAQLPPGVVPMAGPLLKQDGAILGIVVVEQISLLKFTSDTISLFQLLLQTASTALQNTRDISQEQRQALQHIPTTNPLTEDVQPVHAVSVKPQ